MTDSGLMWRRDRYRRASDPLLVPVAGLPGRRAVRPGGPNETFPMSTGRRRVDPTKAFQFGDLIRLRMNSSSCRGVARSTWAAIGSLRDEWPGTPKGLQIVAARPDQRHPAGGNANTTRRESCGFKGVSVARETHSAAE